MDFVSNINEIGALFQLGRDVYSYFFPAVNGGEEQQTQEDVLHLQSELEFLHNTLPYNLIDRAEWKSHKDSVAELLPKLRDAVFDAEDLLPSEVSNLTAGGNATQPDQFINFFRHDTRGSLKKVADIQKRIHYLSSELEKMGVSQETPRFDESVRPQTSSLNKEKIFGRDEELEKVIRLLGVPESSDNNSRAPSRCKRKRNGSSASKGSADVLPIVGIGGVGKTTIAQSVFHHPEVKSHFELRIWICVSDDFGVSRLTKEAIEHSTGSAPTTNNLNALQLALENILSKKRFLIVLDDMWDDALKENEECWKRFYAPFTNVTQGSMILFTTRSQNVADRLATVGPFPLEGLKADFFWDFFKLCIFGSDSSNMNQMLQEIGEEILQKLKGSPLAAKTLGRLLGMSLDPTHWNMILQSELWELNQQETDILPALRLSYMYLPFHLKRCFSFCAVYPKDHEFEKSSLAEIWVAEGFVKPQGNIPLHDIGSQYFQDLVNRSFFQEVNGKHVIHDLMHDMAQLVSKDECFIIKKTSDIMKVPPNVRHVYVQRGRDVNCSKLSILSKHTKLRTIICNRSLKNMDGTSVIQSWCKNLWCLRVIICAAINEVPMSIEKVKHLRYLEVSESCHFNRLPSAISQLYYLQIFYAKKTEFDTFPTVIDNLISLQKFETLRYKYHVHGQVKQLTFRDYPGESLPSWFHPQSFPNLTSLVLRKCKELKDISISRNSRSVNPNEVFLSMTDLTIEECDNLSSLEQFLQGSYLPAIKKIVIAVCIRLESVPTENLSSLEELKVCNCPMIKSRLSSPYLKKLELEKCGNLGSIIECNSLTIFSLSSSHLASIELRKWNLPVLQKLKIERCQNLLVIGESELMFSDISHGRARRSNGKFPKLTHVIIYGCVFLKSIDNQLLDLPSIQSIHIERCPKLSLPLPTQIMLNFSLMDLHLDGLEKINLEARMVLPLSLRRLHLKSLDFSDCFPRCLENLASLESLHITFCWGIVSIPSQMWGSNLASLQELPISHCPDLETTGAVNTIAHIPKVLIEGCPKLTEVRQPLKRGQ